MAGEKTKWVRSVLIQATATLVAFCAGFLLANRIYEKFRYVNTLKLVSGLRRLGVIPSGKLIPATYSIPYDHGRHSIFLRIVGGQTPGSLHEVDIGCGRPSTPTFTFSFKNHDNFHVPLVALTAGHPGTTWVDVGLKGRFLLRMGADGNPMTLLKRTWVPFGHGLGNTFQYKGKYYRYNIASGGWREMRKGARRKRSGNITK